MKTANLKPMGGTVKIRNVIFLLIFVSATAFSQSPWAVMTTDMENQDGAWATRKAFDKEFLQEYYDESYIITYVSWTGTWFLNFERAPKGQAWHQKWRRDPRFPSDFIQQYWDDDYELTDLAHGKDGWMVVMTKLGTKKMQAYATEKNYPKTRKTTESYRRKGYYITSLQHLPRLGMFAAVYTKDPNILEQKIETTGSRKFPTKQVGRYWDKGFTITELTYVEGLGGSGYWVIVASKFKDQLTQGWVTRPEGFPDDWVDKQWEKGRTITMAQLWNY